MQPGERQEVRNEAEFVVPDASDPRVDPGPPVLDGVADAPRAPEAVMAAARRAPGHWIGVVDPEWTEERTPPEWAVLGEWQSDEDGGVGAYRANPAYRPSARVLGWPEPTDPVDVASQRAATGYGTVEAAVAALAEADVTVMRGPEGGALTATGRDGTPTALLFTSPAHEFMSSALRHDTLSARELARALEGSGTMLLVNAGAAAPLLVPADSLLGSVRTTGDEKTSTADAFMAEDVGAPSGRADRTGAPAVSPATDRADGSSEPRPHMTGRTP